MDRESIIESFEEPTNMTAHMVRLFLAGAIMMMSSGLAGAAEGELAKATFAGGCFWCTEAVYAQIKGVQSVTSGYIGGKNPNPTYQQV